MAYTPIKTVKQLLEGILEAVQGVKVLGNVRGTSADLRVTPVGGTVATVTTVSAVSVVTNQTQIGGYSANNQIPALMNTAAVLGNINNIKLA